MINSTATAFLDDLQRAYDNMSYASDRYYTLYARATSAKAISYDRDPVQSSHGYSMVDIIANIDEAKTKYEQAEHDWNTLLTSLDMYCSKAGFDDLTKLIWKQHYGMSKSTRQIATALSISHMYVHRRLIGTYYDAFENAYNN